MILGFYDFLACVLKKRPCSYVTYGKCYNRRQLPHDWLPHACTQYWHNLHTHNPHTSTTHHYASPFFTLQQHQQQDTKSQYLKVFIYFHTRFKAKGKLFIVYKSKICLRKRNVLCTVTVTLYCHFRSLPLFPSAPAPAKGISVLGSIIPEPSS